MKIANIYPIANQEFYKQEDYVMILAHLVKKGLYIPENFNKDQYIIMDNGLFEKAQVSTELIDCINLAENSGIPVKEIIIPDAVNDLDTTIQLFEKSIETIKKWQHKYRFMFVAQAATIEDLNRAFDYVSQYKDELNLSIGISKLTPIERDSFEAIAIYYQTVFPIHFLGIKKSFQELYKVRSLIRGCDTSQVAYIVKNTPYIIDKVYPYVRSEEGIDINLEYDNCDTHNLEETYGREQEELKEHGIL